MKDKKNRADITREERKRQLLKFIENKKAKSLYPQIREKSPLKENKNVKIPSIQREEKPQELESTYINSSDRRKKRREKVAENYARKEELKKQRLVLAQQERQKKLEERKKGKEEKTAEKKAALARIKEEKRQKKLEALRLRQEAELRKGQKKKERAERVAKEVETAKQRKEVALQQKKSLVERNRNQLLKNKEELLSHLASIKEKHNLERQQRLLQKQVILAEKRSAALRKNEEKRLKAEEVQRQKKEASALKESRHKEALRLRQEAELRKGQEKKERAERVAKEVEAAKQRKEVALQKKKSLVERVDNLALEKKIRLLEFVKSRKLLNEQATERKKILKTVAGEKPTAEKPAKGKIIPVPIPVPVVSPKPPVIEKIPVAKKAIPATDSTEEKRISGHIALLVKEAGRLNVLAVQVALGKSVSSVQKFISNFKKKPVSPPEKGLAPHAKKVSRYKEPFLLLPFIRRNAFKFVFLLLILGWVIEIFLLIRKFQEPHERLKSIVGGELFIDIPSEREPAAEEVTEPEMLVLSKPERIDIEGKRDPFSPGLLTMKVLDKPSPTNIVLAPRPEVISILRPAKIVSVIRDEEKLEPKKVGEVTKPQTPAYSSILKPPPAEELLKPSTSTPLEKIQTPEPSPLLIPEKHCALIYRGRMVIEGVEYLFIEGKQKTYRVTVGDVVEGFRILRKEKDKLYLSKDGILYEIVID
jgi:hypothetical protein